MPKISASCHKSECYANYIKTSHTLMQCEIKTSKKKKKNIINNFERI